MQIKRILLIGTLVLVSACYPSSPDGNPISITQDLQNNPTSDSVSPPKREADIIFTNGVILTMDDHNPNAESLAIRENRILAVGTNEEVSGYRGENTIVISLEGKTLVPGFIDSHNHRLGDYTLVGYSSPDQVIPDTLAQGWTTIHELFVDQGRLDTIKHLDENELLRLRVIAYLPANSPQGDPYGEWYTGYQTGQIYSPHVQIAGLKIYMDIRWGQTIHWSQEDLNAFVLKAHSDGWQIAVHTIGSQSLEMLLIAFENAAQASSIAARRHRVEHMLSITPGQIERMKALGLVASIQLNMPGELIEDPAFDAFVERQSQGSITPWRTLFEKGIPMAGGSDWPYFHAEEPSGAPFGSPMHLIYQAVTRAGNLGRPPYPWFLDQTITAEQAIRALTINGAYATFDEDVKGSLTAGKLADMVILSNNPLTVTTEQINEIQVLMTMIDGQVEYCATGSETLCPSVSPAQSAPEPDAQTTYPLATASHFATGSPPSNAMDGNVETIWNAGADPEQWFQIDLGQPRTINAIRLVCSQYPAGETIHQIFGGTDPNNLTLIHEFKGFTADSDLLEFTPSSPLTGIRYIMVMTTQSPSWVAWREIELIILPDK